MDLHQRTPADELIANLLIPIEAISKQKDEIYGDTSVDSPWLLVNLKDIKKLNILTVSLLKQERIFATLNRAVLKIESISE